METQWFEIWPPPIWMVQPVSRSIFRGDCESVDENGWFNLCDLLASKCTSQTTHSVNVHARSVPPEVYIGTLRACQQISADVRSECMGQPTFKACGLSVTFQVYWPMGLHISVWASTLASSGLAGAYLYLDVRIKWTKIVIVAHISDWDSSTFI